VLFINKETGSTLVLNYIRVALNLESKEELLRYKEELVVEVFTTKVNVAT
jgi:hypothetical protein